MFAISIGLRETYDIFPREIYYSLSEARIREYKTRWGNVDLRTPSVDNLLWNSPNEDGNEMGIRAHKLRGEATKGEQEGNELRLLEKKLAKLEKDLFQLRQDGSHSMASMKEHSKIDAIELQLERIEKLLTREKRC